MKEKIINIIQSVPYITFAAFGVILFTIITREGITYDNFLKLVDIIIWPAIVLSALIFFREVFTYMFFSMEEFNFFGARGKLRNVQEVIRGKARELYDSDKREEEILNIKDEFEKKLEEKGIDAQEWKKLAREMLDEYKKLNEDYKKLGGEKVEIQKQINALLNQIGELQKQLIIDKSQ